MIFKYLLTLLLLFTAPHEDALTPVHFTQTAGGGTWECSDEWYHHGEVDYYSWEDCLFAYSGTSESDTVLSGDAHTALFRQVWSDFMDDAERPRLRRGSQAVEEVCWPGAVGCYDHTWELCGIWEMCLTRGTIAVQDRSERLLLHETAHAVYTHWNWHPYWGIIDTGHSLSVTGHDLGFRCFLLEIYNTYTDDVAPDAYGMLSAVCAANGL